jgi:hypothetical protein
MFNDQRKQLLYEFFSDECELAGAENVAVVLQGTYKTVRTEFGENMPVGEIVAFVAGVVGFIDAALSLLDRCKSNGAVSEASLEHDFVTQARTELKIPEEVEDEVITQLLNRIASHRQTK